MLDMNYRKKALLAMVLMLLIPAGQVALADSAAASSCPGPTGHVKKSLMRLVDKWGDAENELSTPQTAVTRSLENEEIRMLMPGKDEKACRALYRAMLISGDRKSTRLNSSHVATSYAVFC